MTLPESNQQGDATASSEIAILFADIGGSTGLYQRAGDSQAHQLIVNSLALMRDSVESSGGTFLRNVGDAILASFDQCDHAREAAIKIQEKHIESELSVRIGFHWGPAIADDGDVYGNAVNIAARVAGLANTGEIMVTSDVVDRLSVDGMPRPQLLDELEVKGIRDPIGIFRLSWRVEAGGSVTIVETDMNARSRRVAKTQILLEIGGDSLVLGEGSGKCAIGRQKCPDTSDTLIATHTAASRLHATIHCKQGVYVLEDLSTNGTYVVKKDQPPVYVHRDTLTLDGEGIIATGFLPEAEAIAKGDAISFVIRAEGAL